MKTYIFISILISFSFLFSFNIFKPKPIVNNENYLTEEIRNVFLNYSEPDTIIDKSKFCDSIGHNIDYVVLDSVSQEILKDKINKSFSKSTVYDKDIAIYGVFKDGSCGGYPILDIQMDCEDGTNTQSYKDGWTGDSWISSDKNARLLFCIVGYADFQTTSFDYAVLFLSSTYIWGVSCIEREIDNENTNNANFAIVTYNGVSSTIDTYGNNKFGRKDYWETNTRLFFNYYPKGSTISYLPSFGISYGVLGRFGKHQGYIFTDDQNSGNDNYLRIHEWNSTTFDHDDKPSGSIPNIIDAGNDTRFYISKNDICFGSN